MRPWSMMLSGAVAAVYLVTALPVLAGQKFSEPNTGFDVEFPDGWKLGRSPNIPVPNVVGVLEAGADRALCVVTAQDVAASRGLTQAQMNQDLRTPLGRDFWQKNIYSALDDVVFESDGVREHPSGIVVQESEVTAGGPGELKSIRLRLTATLIATPGRNYNASCSARPDAFEKHRPAFRAIVDSFRPNRGLSASVNPAPATGGAAAAIKAAAQPDTPPAALLGPQDASATKALFAKPELTK